MRVFLLFLAGLLSAMAQTPGPPANAPWYTPDTIVNTAADLPDWFAPNTFVAIFGSNLSNVTRGLTGSDTISGTLPASLPGTNLRVDVNGVPAYVYYVSPVFVNVLLPAGLSAGPVTLNLVLNGIAGPAVTLQLRDVAPVLVTQNEVTPEGMTTLLAAHGDGTLVTSVAPAGPGETIFLFASGLGQTNPPQASGQVPPYASPLKDVGGFSVWMNGTALDTGLVSYVGILPGNAGTYEIVVTLPAPLPHNPEIRISAGSTMSPPAKVLSTQ